jgi:hypothetical protein
LGALVATGLTLGGCSSPLSTSKLTYIPVLREPNGTVRLARPVGRFDLHSRGKPVLVRAKKPVRKFVLCKHTPYVGSAEWDEEQAQTKRREREVQRSVESICGRC